MLRWLPSLALVGLVACGGGADEVVGIHLTGVDAGGLDDGLATGAGDTAADDETGAEGGEDSTGEEEPLPKVDPSLSETCEPQPETGLYSSCEEASECSTLDTCFQWEGGSSLCSNHCHENRDCPSVPGCGAAASCVRNVCALRCAEDGQCPAPMTCGFLPALGIRLCQ